MTHNICFILLAVDKENNNDPLKIWGLYLFVLAFPGECVNQLGSEVKSIPERSAGWFKTLDVWHRLMLCDIKKIFFFIDMKFGINQAISQTITQLSCIQLETPSSRLWNFWWIKTYTTFNICNFYFVLFWIQYEAIVWIIMGRQVVFSECNSSSCSSWFDSHILKLKAKSRDHVSLQDLVVH